jgi:hypothetical protein
MFDAALSWGIPIVLCRRISGFRAAAEIAASALALPALGSKSGVLGSLGGRC